MTEKQNQAQRIIKHLRNYGPSSILEMIKKLNIIDVRKRISEIRENCKEYRFTIADEWASNRKGVHFKVYYLAPLEQENRNEHKRQIL